MRGLRRRCIGSFFPMANEARPAVGQRPAADQRPPAHSSRTIVVGGYMMRFGCQTAGLKRP